MTPTATLLFRPAMPVWLILLLVILFGATAWLTYLRCAAGHRMRWALWSMRMGAIAVLVWFLLQPDRRSTHVEEEPSILAVAVDVSASMTEQLGGNAQSRAERTAEFLQTSPVQNWIGRHRCAVFEIGGETRERSIDHLRNLTFNAPRSNISTGLNDIARRFQAANIAGILLLTDGLDHAGEDLSPAAAAIPIFALELEDEFEPDEAIVRDAYVDEISYPRTAILNWEAGIEVLVRRTAHGPSSFPVHLFREGERIRTASVAFREGETFRRLSFSMTPNRTGRIYHYVELEVDDDRMDNNMRPFIIDVADPENRVLYLEGHPRWEFRFLKRAMLSEPMFRLNAFVKGTGDAFISFEEDSAMARLDLPTLDHAELGNYKVLILGNLPGNALEAENYRAVRDFVDNGGGLLLLGGNQAFASDGWRDAPFLRDLLPVRFESGGNFVEARLPVELTHVGRSHPALRQLPYQAGGLPPILSLWRPVRVGDFGSALLATLDGSPVVVTRRYGQGRVAIVLTDSLWRWQLGGDTAGEDKSLYNAFITQIVHWLAPDRRQLESGRLLQIVTAKSEYELRERIAIGAVYQAEQPEAFTCTIVTPAGRSLAYPMQPMVLSDDVGLSEATDGHACHFTPTDPGKYTIQVVNAAGTLKAEERILVRAADRELTGKPIDRRFLTRLANATGGEFVRWEERLDLPPRIPSQPRTVEIVRESPVWNKPILYLLLVALFLGEWWIRRHHDLV